MAARPYQMNGTGCCFCSRSLGPAQSSPSHINTSIACSSCRRLHECCRYCGVGEPEATPTHNAVSNAATSLSPSPPPPKRPRGCHYSCCLSRAPFVCLKASCSDNSPNNCSDTAPAGRLLLLPGALLRGIFRFFSIDELPRIASAAPRLWRMLLRGELLQKESITRLHSGRRWVGGGRMDSKGIDESSSSCCSVVPWLLAVQPGRISCLSLSSRVLEPVPPVCLLLALRGQSSSLEELFISSADVCCQGITTGIEASLISYGDLPQEGPPMQSGPLPAGCPQQRKGGAVVSCSEAEELGESPACREETLSKASFVLNGIVFKELRRLRIQGCQLFLWLRILGHCRFPQCRELTIAGTCILQHTVPPPHGSAAAGADLLGLIRGMPQLQLLHLEVALPPTRCFWRGLLFPSEQQQQQQQQPKMQRLVVSEGVFINLAAVLEEAKRGALRVPRPEGPLQQSALREICVVTAERWLHPATMLRSLAAAGCTDTSIPSHSISSEYVEIETTSAHSRTCLQLLPQAVYLKLIIGGDAEEEEGQSSRDDAGIQGLNNQHATGATVLGQGEEQQLPARARTAGLLRAEEAGDRQIQQHHAPPPPVAAEAAAAAPTAAQLLRRASAARSIYLDIRCSKWSFRAVPETDRDPSFNVCPCSVARGPVPQGLVQTPQRDMSRTTSEAARAEIRAPSIRVVGLPSHLKSCVFPLASLNEETRPPCGPPVTCRLCGCGSSPGNDKAGEASAGSPDRRRETGSSNNNNDLPDRDLCVCALLQQRVLPLLDFLPSFLLGHSGAGTSPWSLEAATRLLQCDWLLLQHVCSNALLRSRCIGLDADAGGETPQQRKSFCRFLKAAASLPESLRPPLRLLRLSLVSAPGGPCSVSGVMKLSSRALDVLLKVLQHYPLLRRVEATAPLYLRDPHEGPSAAKQPLPLMQLQQLLKDQGFCRCSCQTRSAFQHLFIFSKTETA